MLSLVLAGVMLLGGTTWQPGWGEITGDKVNLREAPSLEATVLNQVDSKTRVYILGKHPEQPWLEIYEAVDSGTRWVHEDFVKQVQAQEPGVQLFTLHESQDGSALYIAGCLASGTSIRLISGTSWDCSAEVVAPCELIDMDHGYGDFHLASLIKANEKCSERNEVFIAVLGTGKIGPVPMALATQEDAALAKNLISMKVDAAAATDGEPAVASWEISQVWRISGPCVVFIVQHVWPSEVWYDPDGDTRTRFTLLSPNSSKLEISWTKPKFFSIGNEQFVHLTRNHDKAASSDEYIFRLTENGLELALMWSNPGC